VFFYPGFFCIFSPFYGSACVELIGFIIFIECTVSDQVEFFVRDGEWFPEPVNNDLVKIDYGSPRSCGLEAESTGSEGSEHFFRFKKQEGGGGWCDKLLIGEMTLKLEGEGKLVLKVWNKKKTIVESAELTKK